jgi:CRISPR-associated protein Cas2
MLVILSYDVSTKNARIYKICSMYLFSVLDSVFEGELSPAVLKELKDKLNQSLTKKDSIVIYEFDNHKYSRKVQLGVKDKPDFDIY